MAGVKHVHFIGIGGYGMSALAQVLLKMGFRVSGSDIKESALTRRLAEQGAEISYRHSAANIDSCEMAVYSTAIPPENPELREAARRNIPLWHRSELLAVLLNGRYGIAVAGTHGKTTVTSMISLLMERAGMDPTAVIGGVINAFNSNARLGKSKYLVAEACESDHSFLRYRPRLTLVTNVEPDHLEHYGGDYNRLLAAYELFLNNLSPDGCAVLCRDDSFLREVAGRLKRRVVTYALEGENERGAHYVGRSVTADGLGVSFQFCRPGKRPLAVRVSVPGRHNASNAVGALAVITELGVDPEQCIEALKQFSGARRRFEIISKAHGIMVVDDYAHHPTEIKVTIEAARSVGKRLCCIFQPHRYSRTAYFFTDFAAAFRGADLVLLHSIYSAGEAPIEGISSEALAGQIEAVSGVPVFYREEMAELEELALQFATPGDVILVMGAGDINRLAYYMAERLQKS